MFLIAAARILRPIVDMAGWPVFTTLITARITRAVSVGNRPASFLGVGACPIDGSWTAPAASTSDESISRVHHHVAFVRHATVRLDLFQLIDTVAAIKPAAILPTLPCHRKLPYHWA